MGVIFKTLFWLGISYRTVWNTYLNNTFRVSQILTSYLTSLKASEKQLNNRNEQKIGHILRAKHSIISLLLTR